MQFVQLSLAKELCESAISDSCYAPLTRGNLFEIMFPLGVTKLELQLLLEDHLKKLTLDITKERMRNLVIHLSPSKLSSPPLIFDHSHIVYRLS